MKKIVNMDFAAKGVNFNPKLEYGTGQLQLYSLAAPYARCLRELVDFFNIDLDGDGTLYQKAKALVVLFILFIAVIARLDYKMIRFLITWKIGCKDYHG